MALALTAIWGLLLFLPALLGKWRIFEADGVLPAGQRRLSALLPVCLATMLFLVWVNVAKSPWEDWNGARTAPAVAWAKGMGLYFLPGTGPASDFIHGPISAIVRLPAAMTNSPTAAVLIADAVNALLFYGAAIVFIVLLRGGRLETVVAITAFIGFSLTTESLSYAAFNVHADAPAIAFALLACAALLRDRPTFLQLTIAAICIALSIGSKQTFLPLLLILPAIEWFRRNRMGALILLALSLAVLTGLAMLSIRAFGYDAIVYQTITVPAHHPWLMPEHSKPAVLLLMSGFMLQDIGVLAGALAFFVIVVRGNARKTFLFPLAVSILLIPASLIGKSKVGGNVNAYTPTSYFLAIALVSWIATFDFKSQTLAARCSHFLCAALAIASVLPWTKMETSYRMIASLSENPQQVAYEFARKHRGEAYFPWQPLSVLLAENRYDHFDYGVIDLWLAEGSLSQTRVLAYTPPRMKWLIYPPNPYEGEDLERFLPWFNQRANLSELRDWRVYTAEHPTTKETPKETR